MDATSWNRVFGIFLTISAGSAGVGCAPAPAVKQVPSTCASQANPTSFLVKWNRTVPSEYQNLKIHPQSLVTKFVGFRQADFERAILSKHPAQYEMAEHEYSIENIKVAEGAVSATAAPGVWAPQDIQISEAWNFGGKKGDGIVVAVVDSGVDIFHPLLKKQIWVNPGETGIDQNGNNKATNGLDDDGDGFIDDVNGWDFADGLNTVIDQADHGTHVSGIIAGQADGATGFTGAAPNSIIMPLRFISQDGSGSVSDAISAMDYAVAHGAKVINASWGGSACSEILKQNIQAASVSGTVFVNAAGNSGADIGQNPEWPAVYQVPGKITVASYNLNQILSSFSNFGSLVDLASPGENILSTVPPGAGQSEGQLNYKSGTSMATPYVAGVAALLFSVKPSATVGQITDAINNSVIPGRYGVRTGGKLNALNAVKYILSH